MKWEKRDGARPIYSIKLPVATLTVWRSRFEEGWVWGAVTNNYQLVKDRVLYLSTIDDEEAKRCALMEFKRFCQETENAFQRTNELIEGLLDD